MPKRRSVDPPEVVWPTVRNRRLGPLPSEALGQNQPTISRHTLWSGTQASRGYKGRRCCGRVTHPCSPPARDGRSVRSGLTGGHCDHKEQVGRRGHGRTSRRPAKTRNVHPICTRRRSRRALIRRHAALIYLGEERAGHVPIFIFSKTEAWALQENLDVQKAQCRHNCTDSSPTGGDAAHMLCQAIPRQAMKIPEHLREQGRTMSCDNWGHLFGDVEDVATTVSCGEPSQCQPCSVTIPPASVVTRPAVERLPQHAPSIERHCTNKRRAMAKYWKHADAQKDVLRSVADLGNVLKKLLKEKEDVRVQARDAKTLHKGRNGHIFEAEKGEKLCTPKLGIGADRSGEEGKMDTNMERKSMVSKMVSFQCRRWSPRVVSEHTPTTGAAVTCQAAGSAPLPACIDPPAGEHGGHRRPPRQNAICRARTGGEMSGATPFGESGRRVKERLMNREGIERCLQGVGFYLGNENHVCCLGTVTNWVSTRRVGKDGRGIKRRDWVVESRMTGEPAALLYRSLTTPRGQSATVASPDNQSCRGCGRPPVLNLIDPPEETERTCTNASRHIRSPHRTPIGVPVVITSSLIIGPANATARATPARPPDTGGRGTAPTYPPLTDAEQSGGLSRPTRGVRAKEAIPEFRETKIGVVQIDMVELKVLLRVLHIGTGIKTRCGVINLMGDNVHGRVDPYARTRAGMAGAYRTGWSVTQEVVRQPALPSSPK
ncbi:hypothetical protein Bbelb_139580 [Branchiostoma belcheri]|nr:hypothetical protein Bbelb_139580 [Branchiostoma belcheri]